MSLCFRICCLLLPLCAGVPIGAQSTDELAPPTPQSIAEDLSPAAFGLAAVPGADGRLTVTRVSPGSVSDNAGLRTGDVILSVDGQFLTNAGELQEFVAARPTSPISFAIERDGVAETVMVNPLPGAPATTTVRRPDFVSDARPALGVRFRAGNRVVLTETLIGSPAEAAGLQTGDHLVAVNDAVISSSDQFITLVAAADLNDPLTITYVRGVERQSATIAPAAWDVVFNGPDVHVTRKPDGSAVVGVSPTTVAPAYYATNMSPVGVPLTAFPYYSYAAYYGAAWYYPYPYYAYYPGYPNYYVYSPYWYYGWPYAGAWGAHCRCRDDHPPSNEVDSARLSDPTDAGNHRLMASEVSVP
ncbi:MAG: PDZ domain-containing protein [Planctomycetaceae bacterium]|nr:PDZ domain-containing protein [Planctomycetaceae bacterium]